MRLLLLLFGLAALAPAKKGWRFASLLARSRTGVPISACGGKLRIIACTRHGFSRALLGLRANRALVLACAEDPPLIRQILMHLLRRDTLLNHGARAPPDSPPTALIF